MRYKIEMILLAAALSWPAFGQTTINSGKDSGGITSTPKTPHHHKTANNVPTNPTSTADQGTNSGTDITKNGTVGAAGGIVKAPAKTDPEVHNLNSVLPP